MNFENNFSPGFYADIPSNKKSRLSSTFFYRYFPLTFLFPRSRKHARILSREITLNQPAAENYEIGVLSQTRLQPGETATFTVQPKSGLATGNYKETIHISGSDGTSADGR